MSRNFALLKIYNLEKNNNFAFIIIYAGEDYGKKLECPYFNYYLIEDKFAIKQKLDKTYI